MLDIWLVLAGVIKFTLYMCTFFSVGTILYTKFFHQSALNIIPIKPIINTGAIIGIAISILSFIQKGTALTGDISGLYDIEILTMLWDTSVGDVLLLRIIGFVGIIIFSYYFSVKSWVTIISAMLPLLSFSQIGHIVSTENIILQILLWIHLLGICLWLGILYPLHKGIKTKSHRQITIEIAHSFGKSAVKFVPILLLAGFLIIFGLFKTPAMIIGTPYGMVFISKIIIVGLVLGLALANKILLVPALQANKVWAEKLFYLSLNIEIFLLIGVLLATTVLTSGVSLPT